MIRHSSQIVALLYAHSIHPSSRSKTLVRSARVRRQPAGPTATLTDTRPRDDDATRTHGRRVVLACARRIHPRTIFVNVFVGVFVGVSDRIDSPV
jgi:hypothetical protein